MSAQQQYKHLKEMKRALESGANVPAIIAKVLPENLYYNIYGGLTPDAQFREPLIILARPGKYGMSFTKDFCIITIAIQRVAEKPPVRFSPAAPPPANSKIALKQKKKLDEKRGEILNTVLVGPITNYISGGTSSQGQKKIPLFVVARPGAYQLEVEKPDKGYRIYLPIEQKDKEPEAVYNQGQNWVFRKAASLSSTQGTSSSASQYASSPSLASGMSALSVSSDHRRGPNSVHSQSLVGLKRYGSTSTLTNVSSTLQQPQHQRSPTTPIPPYSRPTTSTSYLHQSSSSVSYSRPSSPSPTYPYTASSALAYTIPSASSMVAASAYQSSSAATYPSPASTSHAQRYNPQKLQIPRPKSFAHYADTFGY